MGLWFSFVHRFSFVYSVSFLLWLGFSFAMGLRFSFAYRFVLWDWHPWHMLRVTLERCCRYDDVI